MITLSLFMASLCIFSVTSDGLHEIGRLTKNMEKKRNHPSLNIINGNKTSQAKYPFIASLRISGSEFGAGVVVNKRWILTTAFNVAWEPLESLEFRVGSNSYSNKGQVLKVSKVIVHPNYTGSWDWDIAVVKTDKGIKLNRKVKAATLGTENITGGTPAWVPGWGASDPQSYSPSECLLEAEVTVLDWNKCAKIYGDDFSPRLMCTYDKTVGPSVYDFGDPLVENKKVYGLYAGGYGDDTPDLYTDIPSFIEWIQSAIKSDQP